MNAPDTSPKKGFAAVLPVLGGLVAIAVLAIVVMMREPTRVRTPATPEVVPTQPPAPEVVAPTAIAPPPATTTAAVAVAPPPASGDVPAYPEEDLRHVTPPSDKDQQTGPALSAAKPKMTLDEKLEETKKHIPTIEKHAASLEQEIKEAERAGRTEEANEKRIRVSRLRAHVAELQKAIDEKREPQ